MSNTNNKNIVKSNTNTMKNFSPEKNKTNGTKIAELLK